MKLWVYLTVLANLGNCLSWKKQLEKSGSVSLVDLLAVAIEAVDIGGDVLVEARKSENLDIRQKDDATDYVTYADEESNRRIVSIFRDTFPQIPADHIRSEEHTESSDTPVKMKKGAKLRNNVLRKLHLLPPKAPEEAPPKEANLIDIIIEEPTEEIEFLEPVITINSDFVEPVITVEPTEMPGNDYDLDVTPPTSSEDGTRKRRSAEFRKLLNPEADLSELPYMVDAKDVTVWIDPMDATKEYVEGLWKFPTVMIGVAVKGVPVIGVIRKPFKRVTIWGLDWPGVFATISCEGKSCHKNGIEWTKLQDNYKESEAKITISRSHPGDVEAKIRESDLWPVKFIRAGGSGYKSLEVLNGHAGAYIHTGKIKLWDLCAPNAIINAAGGSFTNLAGKDINYNFDRSYLHYDGVAATMTLGPDVIDANISPEN